MTKIQELEGSLQKLLSTLKKNRERIPLEVLKSFYQQPYYALVGQINETATAFVKTVLTDRLILNPDISIEEQKAVINRVIADSGMARQMSSCISRTYDTSQLYQMALELRRQIESALWPYINLKTCLVFDLDNPEAEPVTYNTLTRQILRDGTWFYQELNLEWKFLYYPNVLGYRNNDLREENEHENYDRTEYCHASARPDYAGNLPNSEAYVLGT
ncbi:hypothetical protein AALD74_12130 [Lachnospiraceae bacterium 48-21]